MRVVLTRDQRLTSRAEFGRAVRLGRRAGTRTVVLHLSVLARDELTTDAGNVRVGFVVSKAVGPAVTRNRVKRRLRNLARERIASLPGPALLVVRALPGAAEASYSSLGADFDSALARLLGTDRRPGATVAGQSA